MLNLKPHRRKAAALLLSAVMLFSSVHFTPPAAAGTEWVQESVDKLSSWGVITRSDASAQKLNAQITRAEFTAMINRAYGYSDTTETPFTDVPAYAWYADDIAIGYNAGYFSGTTETTATPNGNLTREQAITLLARNMRLDPSAGEVTQFSDGRSFSNWSKGYIKSAVDGGIANGFSDGTFRPRSNITRAEMIKLLADSLGTLINTSGAHTLGGVYGNVTINTPGATLRNTTIAGDLYLTGGVGLGSVTLENVNVLGRIIVAGGGESESGAASVVLRNVTAQSMTVDSLSGQYVSLSAQNDTLIPQTTVRTSAYIEDNSRDGMGLLNITLDGEPTLDEDGNAEEMRFTLAGNIKTAVNKTPESLLTVGTGSVENLTISEEAVDSRLVIDADGTVDHLFLDAGVTVTGDGDIGSLTVSAPGVRTSMLPDEIIIRPGLTANIAGTVMDSKLAEESSSSPRLLAGYPKASDIGPTSVQGVFSGNKSGTVYYAITPEVYGPVTDADILVNPPTYGPTYTARGQSRLTASNTEASVRIAGLTVDGTYYLSAVLVDSRGDRSTVKNVMFTTPDNTAPNFATGYPYLSNITETDAQLTAMTTKTCQMYYAIFPRGSAAPTANSFLSNSLEGSVASGVFSMTKNTPITEWTARDLLGDADDPSIRVDYDMYLWLLDFDGGLSSAVRKLEFTTADLTPPEFITLPYATNEQTTSVALTGSLDEDGTVYWVVVAEGDLYPKPPRDPNTDTGAHAVTVIGGLGGGTYEPGDLVTITPETVTTNIFRRWAIDPSSLRVTELDPPEDDDDSISTFVNGTSTFIMPDQAVTATAYFVAPGDESNDDASPIRGTTITTGTGVSLHSDYAKLQVANGLNGLRSGRVNARAMTDFTFTVTGLQPQKRYDVYYVAMDTSGNYSDPVRMVQINTLDNAAPTATQEFTRFPEGDSVNTLRPYADTDIRIIFSEEVKGATSSKSFLELYNDVVAARNNPTEERIAKDTLGSVLASTIELYTLPVGSTLPTLVDTATLDYRNAVVTKEDDGKLVVTFPSSGDSNRCLRLKSGTTYFFRLKDITDTSTAQNRMGQTDLPRFTTISAEVYLEPLNITTIPFEGDVIEADISFSITPRSTSTVEDAIDWDMLIWLNQSAQFDLYWNVDNTGWEKLGNHSVITDGTNFDGISANMRQVNAEGNNDYPQLNNHTMGGLEEGHTYYFSIHFTQIGDMPESERNSWSTRIIAQINVMAGNSVALGNLAANVVANYDEMVENSELSDIGTPKPFRPYRQFSDQRYPEFDNNAPEFEVGDTTAIMKLMLNRLGTVYYVVAPANVVGTSGSFNYGSDVINNVYSAFVDGTIDIPKDGSTGEYRDTLGTGPEIQIRTPLNLNIVNPAGITNPTAKKGSQVVGTSLTEITLTDLQADTDYFVYLVTKGDGQVYSPTELYTFHTEKIVQPILTLERTDNSTVAISTDIRATTNYKLVTNNTNMYAMLQAPFITYVDINKGSLSAGDANISVLDAMQKNAYVPNAAGLYPSLFDQLARDDAKNTMAEFIRSRSGGENIVGVGSRDTVAGGTEVVDCTQHNMTDNIQYVFLAVAKSPQGSGDAFRANYPVTKADREAPYIVDVGYSPVYSGTTITGYEVSLMFNEPLYYNTQTGNPPALKAVTLGTESTDPSRPSDYISATMLKSGGSSLITINTAAANNGIQTNTINLTFNGSQRAFINFTNRICDAVPNSHNSPLQVTFVPVLDENNRPTGDLDIQISPSDWDGRGR